MTSDEWGKYLTQHYDFYCAEEFALALQRVTRRMEPHLDEMAKAIVQEAIQSQLQSFMKQWEADNDVRH